MGALQLILMCLLSCAVGDISEKLKQGQGLSPRESAEFLGLLAPFQDGQRPNVKGGRPSGVKGGAIKGTSQGRQLGAGASNPANRVPIPFRDHTGDDDENNLDRLCNDAFHSFLCKPVGPRRNRIDGRLRPGAQIPPGVISGSSSNQREFKQVPTLSGGALKPTELDSDGYNYPKPADNGYDYPKPAENGNPKPTNNIDTLVSPGYSYPKPAEDGYNYPKPTNNIDTFVSPGYSYPKPPYNYEKPSNQLAYPSQVSESIQKPTNDYLPPFPSTTPTPQTTFISSTTVPPFPKEFGNFNSPSNQIPAQSNQQPVVLNQIETQYPGPFQPSQPQPFSVFSPQTYTFQQTLSTQSFPLITSPATSELNLFTYTTKQAPEYTYTQPSTVSIPFAYTLPSTSFTTPSEAQPLPSNDQGYIYPKPSNDNPIFVSTQPEPTTLSTPQPQFPSNGYLPPVGAPVPKASNVILDSLPFSTPSPFPSFPSTQRTPAFQTTQRIPVFQTTTPRPVTLAPSSPSTTLRPLNIITTTPRPTTFRPYTFRTSTARPTIFQTTLTPSTLRQFVFTTPTTTPRPSAFDFAASNDVSFSQTRLPKPNNGYLPPVNQPVPQPANDVRNVVPFNPPSPFPPNIIRTTTPKPVFTTTFRPYTFQTTPAPTTARPTTFQNTQPPSTLRSFVFTTTTTPRPPVFNFAASNDVAVSQPRFEKPNNGYLPPVNQPVPAPANEVSNVLPFNPPSPFPPNIIRGSSQRPAFTTPRPTPPPTTTTRRPPPPPSREYLPQIDVRGSSTNLSPNFAGGSLLAAEGDAPQADVQKPTTERTHTLEELCRDAFHSFLCKPVGPRKTRIDGRIRPGAKIPPEVMQQLLSAASSPTSRKTRPNQSGGSVLSGSKNPRPQYKQITNPGYQSTNLNPQLIARPAESQPSLFLLAASDSSSLAKAYLKQSTQNVSNSSKNILPSNVNLNYIQGTTKEYPTTARQVVTTPSTTTVRPTRRTTIRTTTTARAATLRPSLSPRTLQAAASAMDVKSTPGKPKSKSGGQLLGSSTNNEGYDYPKPSKPFQFPTTQRPKTTGYEYPKPAKPLTYPSTSASTSAPTSASTGYIYPKPGRPFTFTSTETPRTTKPSSTRPAFGQRLRPTLTDQQRQQQEQQQQIQEDPFSQNELYDKDNELPPASQFEILKP